MQLVFEYREGTSCVAVCSMDGELAAYEAELANVVASDANYRSRVTDKRKREYLVPRLMLKRFFGEEVSVRYSDAGAPLVEGGYVSVSHSGGYAAVVVSSHHRVAVDIERPTPRVERVLHKFLSASEQAFVERHEGVEREALATLYWSAKETLFKYLPGGEVDFQRHLSLLPLMLASSGILPARQTHDAAVEEELSVRFWYLDGLVLTAIF